MHVHHQAEPFSQNRRLTPERPYSNIFPICLETPLPPPPPPITTLTISLNGKADTHWEATDVTENCRKSTNVNTE